MTATLRALLLFQSGYYLATGFWPIVGIGTFQLVTGPKTDLWLVRMVGLLVVVIGATLGSHALKRECPRECLVLALGSCAAFTVIDTVYSFAGIISKIYFADAVVEVLLALGIVLSYRSNRPAASPPPPTASS